MSSEISVPEPEGGEPGWWILVKVALFVAVPAALIGLVKLYMG